MPVLNEVYSDHSLTWFDENGPLKLMHDMNNLLLPYYLDVISQRYQKMLPIDVKLLDVGCGGGYCSEVFAKTGYSVTGIDINSDLIDIAKNHTNSSLTNVSYFVESIETYAERNAEKHDVVVLNFVLQHVENHERFLQKCVECLKPGGIIIIGTLGKNMGAWLMRKCYIEKILKLFPAGLYDYNRCINSFDVEDLLIKHKCKTREVRGFIYNFLTKKCVWLSSSFGWYALYSIKNN